MTKSIPSFEKPLYDAFQRTYQTLLELKNNREAYISSKQVYAIYDQFLRDIHELSIVRKDEELKGITLTVPNATDLLIDDVWQLLSLSFITCGLTKFAPATYLSLSTVYKLLTHLKECKVYSVEDLSPIKARLEEILQIIAQLDENSQEAEVENGTLNHRREETLLLRNKLSKCLRVYKELEDTFRTIPPDLERVYLQLIAVRKSLFNYLTIDANNYDMQGKISEIKGLLKLIGKERDSTGTFITVEGTEDQAESAQMVLNGLLDDCNNLLNDLDIQQDNGISSQFDTLSLEDKQQSELVASFKKLYTDLITIKRTLENLLITRRWTLRETDLYTYQKSLKTIDDKRMELNKLIDQRNGDARRMKKIQLLVLYLLRRNYASIYKLLESSEPVSESLQPIHNQLTTVRRCLLEIKRVDGLNNLRELFPFQFKLASLDNLRHDGKFIVNNQVPEGQGTLNALLAECFDIVYELKIELEEKEENDDLGSDQARNIDDVTDEDDKESDDEVELKRNRYAGFNEADYDVVSESASDLSNTSESEFESNDYY